MWVISYASLIPKWSMLQFDYMLTIPRAPYEVAPLGFRRRDLQAILDDFESHLVLEEYFRELDDRYLAYVEGYMTWFYMVSHPIMTSDALGEPTLASKPEDTLG